MTDKWDEFAKVFLKNKKNYVQLLLHCPDGLDESIGWIIPKDLNDLVSFINELNHDEKWRDYSYTLKIQHPLATLAKLKEGSNETKKD